MGGSTPFRAALLLDDLKGPRPRSRLVVADPACENQSSSETNAGAQRCSVLRNSSAEACRGTLPDPRRLLAAGRDPVTTCGSFESQTRSRGRASRWVTAGTGSPRSARTGLRFGSGSRNARPRCPPSCDELEREWGEDERTAGAEPGREVSIFPIPTSNENGWSDEMTTVS